MSTPATRHYAFWILACACVPLLAAQAAWLMIDPDPMPSDLPTYSPNVTPLTLALLCGTCIGLLLLQWQALRGMMPRPSPLPWRSPAWPMLVAGIMLLHFFIVFVIASEGGVVAWLGSREFAAFVFDTDYFRSLDPPQTPHISTAFFVAALLHGALYCLAPAIELERRAILPWRDLFLCALAGDLVETLADCLRNASGACHYGTYQTLFLDATPADIAFALALRASVAALGGAISCLMFERMTQRMARLQGMAAEPTRAIHLLWVVIGCLLALQTGALLHRGSALF